ncbi:MAG: hypothetical protein AAFO73_08730 [Pseudomonadota bacterium]
MLGALFACQPLSIRLSFAFGRLCSVVQLEVGVKFYPLPFDQHRFFLAASIDKTSALVAHCIFSMNESMPIKSELDV